MDNALSFGVALTFLSVAITYIAIKNIGRNQERENQEKDIELVIYKKEMDRLEERLRSKEISWDNFVKLKKNLEEQHLKNITQIRSKEK